jgi:hypothetical protein
MNIESLPRYPLPSTATDPGAEVDWQLSRFRLVQITLAGVAIAVGLWVAWVLSCALWIGVLGGAARW